MSGQLTHSPADVLRHALIELGKGTLPTANGDWPIFVGGEPNKPDNCITCKDTDGIQEGRDMTSGYMQEHEGVQLRIRAVDHQTGWDRSQLLMAALDTLISYLTVSIDSSTYSLEAVTRTTNIINLGKDTTTSKLNVFTINVIVALTQLS